MHNVFNSACAIALSYAYGIDIETAKKALLKYTGADRRLEYKGTFNGARVYDDYGHHPTEINATYEGIKNKKHKEIYIIFEPHTYSRLKEHLDDFAEILNKFDHIIVMDIYAAREKNTFGIKEEDLLKKLKTGSMHISSYDDIIAYLKHSVKEGDIILTEGAGICK